MAQIRFSSSFFIWACRRGGGNHVTLAYAIQCHRAVGLSALMSGSNGTSGWQFLPFSKLPKLCNELPASHFRFNPSRRLVEPHTRFAASNAQPRLELFPRRDFPAHAYLPEVAALVPHALTPGYQALAPNGAAQGKL